jgi:hypothetical protein
LTRYGSGRSKTDPYNATLRKEDTMKEKLNYDAPELVEVGDARELTEGLGSPNVEGNPGSGVYYNANPPPPPDDGGDK